MRGYTNGFELHFAVLLNAASLVAAETVTTGVEHGGTSTKAFSNRLPLDPSRTPTATPTGNLNADSSHITTPTSTTSSTPITTAAAQGSSTSAQNRVSPGVIAGIFVGVVVLVVVALGIFLRCRRGQRRQRQHSGAVNLKVDLDPVGTPVYEKRFIPSPFITDTEATVFGYDQSTRRIEAKFTTLTESGSAHAHLTIPSPGLPVLLSNSGYSSELPASSRSTLASHRPDATSEEDTLSDKAPPHRMHNLLA